MSVRLLLAVILFSNYLWVCKSETTDDIISQIEYFLKHNKNLSSLPKNYVFDKEELQNNIKAYNEGLNSEDVSLNGTQLIEKYGYDVEEHRVTTSDGYVLAVYRIPCKDTCKGVVFLMHGLLSCFVDWLTAGPDKGLAYRLAASGYDVWMGNARGNKFSKKHITLSPSDDEFWDFSWDEIGRYDLPAMIDYVLDNTGEKDLIYIGNSQGTTTFFVLCSELPEYNNKIRLMIALSAVAWMKHVVSPLAQIVSPFSGLIYVLASALGVNNVPPNENLRKAIIPSVCGNSFLASIVCQNIGFVFFGFSYSQINYRQLPIIFSQLGSKGSLRQFLHYAQLITSGYFRKYDYGTLLNMKKYLSPSPPFYPVDKISVPTAIFYSNGDWFSNPIDVDVLKGKLQNVVDYFEVPLQTFNHVDYIFGKDINLLINDKVLELISKSYANK